jgi:hypothetical protein
VIKAIVVSLSYSQFATYIRNRRLNRAEYGHYKATKPEHCYGLPQNTKVLWLEGWSENPDLTVKDVQFLKDRFYNHQEVSEVWIYGEDFSL